MPPDRLLAELVPPRHFADESFATYRPDPAHPSQAAAVTRLSAAAEEIRRGVQKSFWKRGKATPVAVYLDGGFGVGKTHLLTSLAHAVGVQDAAYGTFVEYTNLVGALGFLPTVEALATRRLVCIDEFELDDPGDTVLMSRLLRELADRGVALAATSNTLPGSLGEGRFAAEDFLREIQALAARFEVLRVDGDDYRHRSVVTDADGLDDDEVRAAAARRPDATLDDFGDLLAHLATVHPSRYGALLDGVGLVARDRGARRPDAGRGAAARRAGRPALRPRRARPAGRRGGEGAVLRGDARRRLPQEVLPSAVPPRLPRRGRRRARRLTPSAANLETPEQSHGRHDPVRPAARASGALSVALPRAPALAVVPDQPGRGGQSCSRLRLP